MKKKNNLVQTLVILLILVLTLQAAIAQSNTSYELEEVLENKSNGEKIDILLTAENEPTQQNINAINNLGGVIEEEYDIIDGFAITLTVEALDELQEKGFVDEIEYDYDVSTMLSDSSSKVNAVSIRENQGITGQDINVAVLDSGISNHEHLDVSLDRDHTGDGIQDRNGHGTHVAGIIASKHPENTGITPDANIQNIKVLNDEGQGKASNVIKGLETAINNDADIITLSLGAEIEQCDGTDAISRAVDQVTNQGIITIVAAGNTGPEQGTITSPGCARNAITVGAINNQNRITEFSARGPTYDGRNKPDIVAPGSQIISTHLNNEMIALSGTSMAAPHISGIAAMSKQKEPSLTPQQFKNLLKDTATDIGRDYNQQGAGLANTQKLIQELTNKETPEVFAELKPLNNSININDTLENEDPIAVNISGEVDSLNQSMDIALSMNNQLIAEKTVNGQETFSYKVENISEGQSVEWRLDATTQTETFTTGSMFFETESGQEIGIQRSVNKEPLILPGTPLYKLKRLGEEIRLFLTRDEQRKAELRLEYADRRLAEAQLLEETHQFELFEQTLGFYSHELNQINEKDVNSDIEQQIELRKKELDNIVQCVEEEYQRLAEENNDVVVA